MQDLGLIAEHPTTRRAVEMAANLAWGGSAILVQGETGTGKELFARFIHRLSGRPAERFEEGRLREDPYYRVAVGIIELPPLRELPSDIPTIALRVLDKINSSLRRPKRLTTSALQRLQTHNWPGNIRDLHNVIERSARMCPRDVLEADDLMIGDPRSRRDPLAGLPASHEGFSLEDFLSRARHQFFLLALETTGGNQSAAVRLLGVSPQAVQRFVRENAGEK